jgi:DNA-binding CsgD family transcriptional regulator
MSGSLPKSPGVALPLRVAVRAAAPETAARLAALAGALGHRLVDAAEAADTLLTDGSGPSVGAVPVLALGAAQGDFAGLLPEGCPPAQLDAALRAVAAGLRVCPPRGAQLRFEALPEPPVPLLTRREIEVLTLFAEGLSNKAAARRLGISPHTVKFHSETLFKKLGVGSRAEAVAKGVRRQIVEF